MENEVKWQRVKSMKNFVKFTESNVLVWRNWLILQRPQSEKLSPSPAGGKRGRETFSQLERLTFRAGNCSGL